jgi:glycosyltransferase involved in cell wall biosynthesis
MRSLAERGHHVTVVAETKVSADRQALAWEAADYGSASVVVDPSDSQIETLVQESPADAIHIVSALRGYRIGRLALRKCMARASRVGLMCEAPDPRGLKGVVRRFLYTAERLTWTRRVGFVLATGEIAVNWYRRAGYSNVHSFGYTVESPEIEKQDAQTISNKVGIIYIGRCAPEKGVDILLRALKLLQALDWDLTIIGDGVSKGALVQLANELGLAERIHFLGVMPNRLALQYLMASDLFVLPSRQDGWGSVVNEALMCGVPVICSSACGAKDLVSEPWRGEVFPSGSVHRLAQVLGKWIAQGQRTETQRDRLRAWSSRTIAGDIAADYLAGILAHIYGHAPLPAPPWKLQVDKSLDLQSKP